MTLDFSLLFLFVEFYDEFEVFVFPIFLELDVGTGFLFVVVFDINGGLQVL